MAKLFEGDSSHPSAAQLRQLPPPPSFGALVASYDTTCVTYTAVASAQAATTELMETFSPMFKELMSRYQKKNGKLPQAIVYFRDGIAESQIPEFKATECKALKGTTSLHLLDLIVLTALQKSARARDRISSLP